jgi:hypothetical protein
MYYKVWSYIFLFVMTAQFCFALAVIKLLPCVFFYIFVTLHSLLLPFCYMLGSLLVASMFTYLRAVSGSCARIFLKCIWRFEYLLSNLFSFILNYTSARFCTLRWRGCCLCKCHTSCSPHCFSFTVGISCSVVFHVCGRFCVRYLASLLTRCLL